MTRRDTIIIATLVNAALLACLFVVATKQEEAEPQIAMTQESYDQPIPTASLSNEDNTPLSVSDEVDLALREFLPEEPKLTEMAEPTLDPVLDAELNPELVKEQMKPDPEPPLAIPSPPKTEGKIVEVTVKAGDMLEKIAKANNTTVKAIKEASDLRTDKLKIGQVLKVPVGIKVAKSSQKPAAAPVTAGEPVYYTVQKGDNPWKIAKKFHVKFEDILKLNNMSEEKAKNLKVGQEIRVK